MKTKRIFGLTYKSFWAMVLATTAVLVTAVFIGLFIPSFGVFYGFGGFAGIFFGAYAAVKFMEDEIREEINQKNTQVNTPPNRHLEITKSGDGQMTAYRTNR